MKKFIVMSTLFLGGIVGMTAWSMMDQKNGAAAAPAKAKTARPTKIAIVEPQAIIAASEEWKDKATEVQQEFEKRAVDLRNQREDLAKKAKAAAGTASERDVVKDLAKKKNDIEIEERSLDMDFQQRQQEMQMAIAQKVDAAIEAVEKAQGWDATVPKFFGSRNKDIDITQDAIEELNKEYRKEKAAKKFKKDNAPRVAVPQITEKK